MSRLSTLFETLRSQNESALVGFVSAGDPNPQMSLDLVSAMCDAGIDILELGIPFSDPTADGPVIQRSSSRALNAGMTVSKVIEMTRKLRDRHDQPIILFSYYNPILAYGLEKFYADAKSAGADGVLIVDLPPEESDEFTQLFDDPDFSMIRLVAPTTPKPRMAKISEAGSGFLYLISKTGVTGSDGLDTTSISDHVNTLKSVTTLPVCVGFGISTPEDVARVAVDADGVVIGSAFERCIEDHLDDPDLPKRMAAMVAPLKLATRK